MDEPSLSIAFKLLAVLILVLANGFFVAAEFSLVTVRKTRVDQLVSQGSGRARTVHKAIKDPDSFIAATQLGITMASLALGWVGEPALAHLMQPLFARLPGMLAALGSHSVAIALAFALITAMHIVLGELAPKTIALQHSERTAFLVARPLDVFLFIFRPFVWLLNGAGSGVVRVLGLRPPSGDLLVHSEEELRMLVSASGEAGVIEEGQQEMLHRVFAFGDFAAHQVMVPRTEMLAVAIDIPWHELLAVITEGPHTRLPVYEGDIDNVVGVLHVKDLFAVVGTDMAERLDLRALIRRPLMVPETIRADDLLAQMKRDKTHMAILIDQYGGTAGLVTLADLLERIVGEVRDEFQDEGAEIQPLADGSSLLDGLVLIDDVNERFGLALQDEYFDTIGGYVFGRLGRKPELGDTVAVNDHLLEVQLLDGLRIARVRLRKRDGEPAARPAQ